MPNIPASIVVSSVFKLWIFSPVSVGKNTAQARVTAWRPMACLLSCACQNQMIKSMKHYSLKITDGKRSRSVAIPAGLKSEINLLVFVHLLFFLLYAVIDRTGLFEQSLADGTVSDFIGTRLALSHRIEDMQSYWWAGIFTYQFVHSDFLELILSVGLLWLFGHILKTKIGERKVILLYVTCVTFAAIAFFLSHFVFRIFSADTGIMEGAFCGTLGIMTACVIYSGTSQLHLYGGKSVALWKVFVFGTAFYLISFYQHNMAYILMLICSSYTGYRYAFTRPELVTAYAMKAE
jgi:membrane associated rhomboid family serine protease